MPYFPSYGFINISFGLPNFPTIFVEPSVIRDTEILIEMPFNTKNVSIEIDQNLLHFHDAGQHPPI